MTTIDEFRAAETQWRDLHRACGAGPFSDFDWLLTTLEVFEADRDKICIVVVEHDGVWLAAAPFSIRREPIVRVLGWRQATLTMLSRERNGYNELLMRPGAQGAMQKIARYCATNIGVAYADIMPIKSNDAYRAWAEWLIDQGYWLQSRAEIRNASVDLSAGPDGYIARRSAKMRKRLRRIERRLADTATVRSTLQGAPFDSLLDDAFLVASRSWKAQVGTAISATSADRAFFQKLAERMVPQGKMAIIVIYIDERPVAHAVDFIAAGTGYGLVADYDAGCADLELGHHILHLEVCEMARVGAQYFDCLRATPMTTSHADRFDAYLRVRTAFRPTPARWATQVEACLRNLAKRLGLKKPRPTGRLKHFPNGLAPQ